MQSKWVGALVIVIKQNCDLRHYLLFTAVKFHYLNTQTFIPRNLTYNHEHGLKRDALVISRIEVSGPGFCKDTD